MADARVGELIDLLQLEPHPEGGFYREIHRSDRSVRPDDGRPSRAALTTIYYLLPAGEESRWHRVGSDEIWHLYEGDLELAVVPPDLTRLERVRLGRVSAAVGPVFTVPAGWWQSARPVGPCALCGCTVGPGFDFEDITFLDDDPDAAARLLELAGRDGKDLE